MKEEYKVGDTYYQMSLGYFLHLNDGGDEDGYPESEQYHACKVRYITPEGGLVLEVEDLAKDVDGTFDTTLFSGATIKAEYPDFDGDDDTLYSLPFYEGCPFF